MPFVFVEKNLIQAVRFDSGTVSSFAVSASTGTLWCAGYNSNGIFGTGDFNGGAWRDTSKPAVAIKTGGINVATAFAYMWDGTDLWANGNNDFGQLAQGDTVDTTSYVDTGMSIDHDDAFSVGYGHVAIISGGTVWTCGNNDNGQLGLGDTSPRNVFTDTGIVADRVMCSSQQTFILKDGVIWSCGRNQYGTLGLGNFTTPITTFTNTSQAADQFVNVNSSSQSVGMILGGILYTCGLNNGYQLCLGDTTNRNVFTSTGVSCTSASIGSHSLVVSGGTVYSVGSNGDGQCGLGSTTSPITSLTSTGFSAVEVNVGAFNSMAKTNTGALYGCGSNSDGQNGTGGSIADKLNFTPMSFNVPV